MNKNLKYHKLLAKAEFGFTVVTNQFSVVVQNVRWTICWSQCTWTPMLKDCPLERLLQNTVWTVNDVLSWSTTFFSKVCGSTQKGMDQFKSRVWIDSIKGWGLTQDVIDGPHCCDFRKVLATMCYLELYVLGYIVCKDHYQDEWKRKWVAGHSS